MQKNDVVTVTIEDMGCLLYTSIAWTYPRIDVRGERKSWETLATIFFWYSSISFNWEDI